MPNIQPSLLAEQSYFSFRSEHIMLNVLADSLHWPIIPSDHSGKDMLGKHLDVKPLLIPLSFIFAFYFFLLS